MMANRVRTDKSICAKTLIEIEHTENYEKLSLFIKTLSPFWLNRRSVLPFKLEFTHICSGFSCNLGATYSLDLDLEKWKIHVFSFDDRDQKLKFYFTQTLNRFLPNFSYR